VCPPTRRYASTCFFPTSWLAVPLISATTYNHDTKIFEFGLPAGRSLDLPVCACLLLRAGVDADGEDIVRQYTPISANSTVGSFQLMVKVYDQGVASQHLAGMAIGETVEFKHIEFNIKAQHPFGKSHISMICGGSGITPMYQALQLLLEEGTDDSTEITMLYGNKTVEDILLKDELDSMAAAHPGRFKCVYVVGDKPDDPPPAGLAGSEGGWIDSDKIAKYVPAPSADTSIFVCGLPQMYAALCGPRDEPEVAEGTVLDALGYTAEHVEKF
jgi:cytochrome-b5 reductase